SFNSQTIIANPPPAPRVANNPIPASVPSDLPRLDGSAFIFPVLLSISPREKVFVSCHPEVFMSRPLRYILIGVGVLIILLIALPFFIPVNQFKPTIEQR